MQLSAEHLAALAWFRAHASETIGWPQPLEGLFLANRAKGIHKPAGWRYALSIRLALDGPYPDAHRGEGGDAWSIEYSQEGADSNYFTNRALLACMADAVPIGVLKQVRDSPRSEYRVLGLGYVTSFDGQSFQISSAPPGDVDGEIRTVFVEFDAFDQSDRRRQRQGMIADRIGQPDFRDRLVRAYSGRCAISECNVSAALEAAHILCYRGTHTNHVQNGLLLRADIHSLFDVGLISIDPDYTISVDATLVNSEYFQYNGKRIRMPIDERFRPHPEALRRRQRDMEIST
ncbi:HNH endonuclease [Roseateles sp. L2-2]|uniref:HNH endonuclease n=1 Tax=Roseateles sp. L2-2 TaxID=3422597 RepID=UPI003D35A2DD